MRRALAFVLASAGLIFSASAAVAAWQDTNLCDVPSADFPTIQSAIDQPLCFTVRLGVFTFTEQLTISRSVTLGGQSFQHGDEQFVSRLRPPAGMSSPVLIDVVGPRSRVKIKHIVIEGPATGDHLIGLRAGRDTRVTIRDCVFRDMRPATFDSRWSFVAMHLGGPLVPKTKVGISGHSITNCRFEGYQNAAFLVEGSGTIATIAGNVIDARGRSNAVRPAEAAGPMGVFAYDGAQVTVDHNDIVNNSREGGGAGTGVMLTNVASTSIVSFNNIDRNDAGIGLDGASGVEIYRNGLAGNGAGIVLGWDKGADANSILLNRVENGVTGMYLGRANSNSLSNNIISGNFPGDGILFSEEASKNKMYRNRAENNGGAGYVDASQGTGTAGTANTYTSNLCSGNNSGGDQSEPVGLCSK